jgi:hypothetical protein
LNNHKLFLAASTAIVAVATIAAPVHAASAHPFTDVAPRYDEAISFLYEYDMINGKTATQFGTTQQLTRGDAAVILANAIGVDTENAPDAGFTDLNIRVKGAVNGLAELGIVSGVTKTQYKPNEILSRGAMAKFLVTAFELEEFETETPFTDVGGVFAPYIGALYGTEITSGKTPTSYGTYAHITRGEFAVLLYNTFLFAFENFYYPEVAAVELINKTSFKVKMTEAVPAEFRAQGIVDAFYFTVRFADGTEVEFTPTTASLSADRMFATFNVGNVDLSGEKGQIIVDDLEKEMYIPFDFTVAPTTP